jgi:endonuclease/exonuclease/phosphatase family metal-dependent hydrolase
MAFLASPLLSVAATSASVVISSLGPAPPGPRIAVPVRPPEAGQTFQISILTYNIHGLPWPIAEGRGHALRSIGRELAAMRRAGRQPDVVLIQEGFRDEISDLAKASGYRFWARGPERDDRAPADGPTRAYPAVRYPLAGEGWGKFTGSGLHVLSDLPIVAVRGEAYRACAGFDCLANKGVMLVRVALPGGGGEVDIVNTHLNARGASKTPPARTLAAHNQQTAQLLAFIKREHRPDIPLLVGGDFNVRNAPARYDYDAGSRPYRVVSEFCAAADADCAGQAPAADGKPWLRSQDLQAFSAGGPIEVRPVGVATVFDATKGERALSDHAGYLVRYRLNWDPTALARAPSPPTVQIKPTLGPVGLKVSWRR